MAQGWEVVGGADKGGIIVRAAKSIKSEQLADRLSTGALIEQLELEGDRLKYRLVSGTGPSEGWVSIKLTGKELVVKSDKAAGAAAAPLVADDLAGAARIEARCKAELAKTQVPWTYISIETVTNGHMKRAPGMLYGIEFPWNEETLAEFGPAWLTRAFHKAGTLPCDNKVTKIILEQKIKVTTGNNGGKFLFEVEYEKASPDLHTKLFAKVPFPLSDKTKSDRLSSSVNKQPQEYAEINTYRLLEASIPAKVPKFYYGDISCESTNWILITERVDFKDFEGMNFGPPPASRPEPLKPFEIEGPYDKCVDYNLRGDPAEYYLELAKVGGKMAGLYKAGKMGTPEQLNVSFGNASLRPMEQWGMNPGASSGEMAKMVKGKLDGAVTFISEVGKVLYPSYCSDPAFIQKFRTTMMTMAAYSAELNFWKNSNPDYVALTHQNLNVDNAYFWRNAEGQLELGVFDWGNLGASGVGHKMWWWVYCSDFEVFQANLDRWIEAFAAAYKEAGGPAVDKDVLRMQTILSAMEQMLGLNAAVPQIYRMCSKKDWPSIKDRYDPRISENIDGKSTLRLYLHVMNTIIRIIEEMKGDEVLQKWISDVYVKQFGQAPKTEAMINGA
mmetsp:Transcript_46658/g.137858  ORF Transcript_46658/g.137858 Transcript_46658/m.137858 type:complete len:614 (+) Transcript_46658:87-1928(+)